MPEVDVVATVGIKTIDAGAVEEAENIAEKAGEVVENQLSNPKNTAGLGKNLAYIAQKFKKQFSGFKWFDLLTGKLTAAVILVSSLVKTVGTMIKGLFVPIETQINKTEAKLTRMKQKASEEQNNQKQDNSYIQELQTMAKNESLSNAEKKRAIQLVKELAKRYGELGISVNTATGEIKGLDNALPKMQKTQISRNINQKRDQANQQNVLAGAQAHMAFRQVQEMGFGSVFNIAEQFGFSHKNVKNADQVFQKLGLDNQIKMFQQMIDKAKNDDQLNKFKKVLDALYQQKKVRTQIADLEKQLENYDENSLRAEQALTRQIWKQEDAKAEVLKQQRKQIEQQARFNALKQDEDKISFYQEKIQANNTAISNIKSANDSITNYRYGDQAQRAFDKARILDLKNVLSGNFDDETKADASREIERLETKIYRFDKERAKDVAQIAKNETQIEKRLTANAQFQAKIDELKKRSNDYYDKQIQALETQFDIQRLMLQGRYAEAEQLKIINQLKEQGLTIDNKQVATMKNRRQAMAQMNINKGMINQAESLLDQFSPNTKENIVQRKIRDLEKANNTKLNKSQRQKIQQLVDIEFNLNDVKKLMPKLGSVQSNQLTARGGFAGGAVVPDLDENTKNIAGYVKMTNTYLGQIKQIVKDLKNI